MTTLPAGLRSVLGALVLLAIVASAAPASAQPAPAQSGQLVNPDALAVNQDTLLREAPRIEGSILIPNPREAVLVQPAGRVWDYFHEILLRPIALVVIFGMVALLAIFYFALGRLRIAAGRSGARVPRFNAFERFSHWLTATSFVVLALTGLNITFGKVALRPLIGPDTFSTVAQYAKYAHNFVSFSFVAGLVLVGVMWARQNIPGRMDITWLKEGGGIIGSKHPTAGRFNAGQKLIFWFVLGAGAGVAISGYLLLFPFYVTNIFGMQIAQVVHSLIAVVFVAVVIAHIYIGTLGMEGAFEAMATGSVDLNWAKQHHRAWVEEEVAKGHLPQQTLSATSAE
jgi:formate dehydrogenase subunit gamma